MKILSLVAMALFASGIASATPGLRSEMTVMSGALIRAGGPGGQVSLRTETLQALCEQGVSTVFYLYPSVNFKTKGTYNCGGNTLVYTGGEFRGGGVKAVLEQVAQAASGSKGPVLVHCWNGWHATGEVAAYALQQFCGWSGQQAADYWVANLKDKGNLGKYGSIVKRIKNFQPFSDLRLSEQDRARACP